MPHITSVLVHEKEKRSRSLRKHIRGAAKGKVNAGVRREGLRQTAAAGKLNRAPC